MLVSWICKVIKRKEGRQICLLLGYEKLKRKEEKCLRVLTATPFLRLSLIEMRLGKSYEI